MERRQAARAILWSFISVGSILFSPLIVHSAPPGIETFSDGMGVATWSTNAASPFTALEHWVRIIDYNGIASGGTSHTVQVTYPNATVKTLQYRYHKDASSALYELYDSSIPQPISPATYNGTYTYKVTRVAGGEWSEATDDLEVNPVTPLDETTFTPGLPEQQAITAYFDDVYTNGSLYDDFSLGFDPTKWQAVPSGVSFPSGEAKFEKTWNTGSGAARMRIVNPGAVNSIKATTRLDYFSGSSPFTRARVGGNFCRIAEGDIFAYVGLRGNEAVYGLSADKYDENHYISTPLVFLGSLGSVTQGKKYELSVEWDTVSQVTVRVVGLEDTVNYSASYTLSGTISPANDPWKGIDISAFCVVDTTTPTFSWAEVPEATHYRVRIYGMNDSTIYAGYATSSPFVLPPGILKPYGFYKYRIEAINDHQWFEWDNIAASDRNKTLLAVNTSEEAQVPYIDLFSNGVLTVKNPYTSDALSFYFEVHDAQGVPGNIESVKVLFPDGSTVVPIYYNYNITSTRAQYNAFYYGPVQTGTYTFTVEDKDGNTHTVTEDLEPNAIDSSSEGSLIPAHNTVLGGTGVTFDWEAVDGAVYYEVQIFDKNLNSLYRLRAAEGQTHFTLPPGILQENQLYKYKINSLRELPEDNFDNFSDAPTSPYNDFFTTSLTGGAGSPTLDLVNLGVVVYTGPHPVTGVPTYEIDISAKVNDADGVPQNIQKVEVTYPDGTTKKLLKYYVQPAYGYNYLYQEVFDDPSSIQSGTYTIRVYDFDGHQAEVTDTLGDVASNAIPWPTNVMPPNDVSLNNTTPTITWSSVNGALYYRVRILDSWGSDTTILWSPDLSTTHYTVPVGVLSPHTTYAYRVYAYGDPSGNEADFVSTHVSPHSLNYHFTTGEATEEPNLDFDGDSNADILLRNMTTGEIRIWLIDGTARRSWGSPGTLAPVWQIEGVADFNADGNSDVLLRRTDTGELRIWLINGTTRTSWGSPGAPTLVWKIEGVADFNADGKSDILLRRTDTGELRIWLIDGTTRTSYGSPGAPGLVWEIQGVADFNGDGKSDILLRRTDTGELRIWLIDGTTRTSYGSPGAPGLVWEIQGVADFDGDGNSDMLLRRTDTGEIRIWLIDGTTRTSYGSPGAPGLVWEIQGVADFDGDGNSDILLRRTDTGEIRIWLIDGTARTSYGSPGAPALVWEIQEVADFNGDGNSDMLLRRTDTGEIRIWLIDGTARTSWGSPGAPALVWEIQ